MADRIPPPASAASGTHCTPDQYNELYARSIADPDGFWAEQALRIDWVTAPTRIANWSYDPVEIKWFEDGVLSLCYNCVDRHLAARSADPAIVFEGDEPGVVRTLSYGELHAEVVRMANCLKAVGAGKGDRVTLYMPMIPEAAVAMLACARIGAVHSVVFGGFSPEALHGRIEDCASRFVVTADGGKRGGKLIPLKANVDAALDKGADVAAVIVVRHLGNEIEMREGRDHWYDALGATMPDDCPCEAMGAEDPLFILYTSGSTGKPKGVLHTTGGYAVWTTTTFHYVFDYRPGELFWCTADVGWVTGHSYVVYGPLANGATTLMFEGVPNHPDFSRFWDVIERHKVNIFYTAPTAIRALMREGDAPVTKHDRSSLRLLGSVGEPINPEAWLWYWRVAGDGRCPIVDTWWQTETGGIMITTLPAAHDMKPGSAGRPFFGIVPELVDANGGVLDGSASGNLCIARSWPGQMRTVYGDHDRFVQTYFSAYRGKYFTGDGCRRDADSYYWITGRVDDVLNISGHRLGTAEIESALVSHPLVAEAAVVGYPHDIKGTGIYCYVTLNAGVEPSVALEAELRQQVRTEISAIATPDLIHFTPALPKTRSGKIMRRILRKIAENDYGALGDTSTLADPSLVDDLIEGAAQPRMKIVAADIGGTHARFALAEIGDGALPRLGPMKRYRTREHDGLASAWAAFARDCGEKLPRDAALAVAAPIEGEILTFMNCDWRIERATLAAELGLERMILLNDFGAVANAVSVLGPDALDPIMGPDAPFPEDGVTTVLGAGTGLGVALFRRSHGAVTIIETEASHIAFAPLDAEEEGLRDALAARYGRASVERVVCGPGLIDIYRFLGGCDWDETRPGDLWSAAIDGNDPVAAHGLDIFVRCFGAACGDISLAHGAMGVAITGGLANRIGHLLRGPEFAERFLAKGRYRPRMTRIPVKLVTTEEPGLLGAAVAFQREWTN